MNILNILIVTFCILIGLMIYMSVSLYQLKKTAKSETSSLSDQRYFELKYQHQLFVSVGAIIVFLVSFFGWNSLEGIQKNLDNQIAEKMKSLNAFELKQNKLNEDFTSLEKAISMQQRAANESLISFKNKLNTSTFVLNDLFSTAKIKIDSIENDVNGLSDIIAKNPSIYILEKKVGGWIDGYSKTDTIRYKDCKVIKNQIPVFDSAPIIIPFNPDGVSGYISQVEKGFYVYEWYSMYVQPDSLDVTFLIFDF